MSISLDVVPLVARIPTVAEFSAEMWSVLESLADDRVAARMWADEHVTVGHPLVEIVDESSDSDHLIRSSSGTRALDMGEGTYGWVSMDDYKVGFDFYFYPDVDDHVDGFEDGHASEEMILRAVNDPDLTGFPFDQAAGMSHCWGMRGRVGRTRATWLLAGVTAVALARLTHGFIWSDNGGADWERMPVSAGRFLDWFPAWIECEFLNFSD